MAFPYELTIFGLGFLLGLKHALEADHVVAVSTIVSQTKNLRKSLVLGAVWGMGHTTTLFVMGLLILLFKVTIPEKLAFGFEFIVGIVLVLLGLELLYKTFFKKEHIHMHKHGTLVHSHSHKHNKIKSHNHNHKSFALGMIHGIAGSAAITLLVIATINSLIKGLLFILIFGAGSILGMLLISGVIATPFLLTNKINRLERIIQIVAAIISIIIGIVIMSSLLPKII